MKPIHYLYYSCPDLLTREFCATKVMVRYDPFDFSRAFVYLRDRWVECRSERAQTFRGHTERELAVAAAKLRRRLSCAQAAKAVTAHQLAEFFESLRGEEVQRRRMRQDRIDERRELAVAWDLARTSVSSLETPDRPVCCYEI